jgi:hypothetical protein
LALSGDTLYGATEHCLAGTVFKVNTDGTDFATLKDFGYTIGWLDGADPEAGFVVSGKSLYGTTSGGTVFTVNTDGTGFTNLYNFSSLGTNSSGVYTNTDGAHPWGSLILSGDTIYGSAQDGGASGNGTIFSISLPLQLTITSAAASVVLMWPTNFTGFILQSTTNLTSPFWTTNLPATIVVDGQYTVTNPISGTQQFFRLSQ